MLKTTELLDRMQADKIPGVSIAVIDGGELARAGGYGALYVGDNRPVTTPTLFQACSLSKPIAAMAALTLVQQGKLDLDEDVNQRLVSWQVPENEFTKDAKVTLRRLLTHTAGLAVSGFRGYAADEQVPTLHQILEGSPPANSVPIRVDTIPGTQWRYSGGGFTVLQQLLIDVTGRPFPEIMQDLVLEKLGMAQSSTYEQPLPMHLRTEAACAHDETGARVRGDWFTYPEMAAGGLWTTPSDLARLAIEIQKSNVGASSKVLSAAMTDQMLSDQMEDFPIEMVSQRYSREIRNQGLGFRLEGQPVRRSARFSHHGGNMGYRCFIVAYSDREAGQGAVVMTNSDNGAEFIQEIVRSIAQEYGWVDYPLDRQE
jgi:CubicO group peptidase (beta-lactamase class C family)